MKCYIYPYKGILFVNKGYEVPITLQQGQIFKTYVEWKKSGTRNYMLYDSISTKFLWNFQISKSRETESRLVVNRSWEKRKWGVTAHGYRVSFRCSENILELNSSKDCIILWLYLKKTQVYQKTKSKLKNMVKKSMIRTLMLE